MDTVVANVIALILTILAALPAVLLMDNPYSAISSKDLAIFFFIYFVWMFLHEALHGLGHILCGVKPSELSYGAALEKSVLFCLVRKEVNKKGILISLLFPFFFIGVVTYIIAFIINSPMLVN